MTTRNAKVGQAKQEFRGVLVMTAATAALLGGVVLFQLRPTSDTAAPTTASHSRVSDGLTQVREPASRSHEEGAQRSDAEMYSRVQSGAETSPPQGGMAELYAELQTGAGTAPATSVAVDTLGGMAELYRDQRAAADQHRARGTCGEDMLQPITC